MSRPIRMTDSKENKMSFSVTSQDQLGLMEKVLSINVVYYLNRLRVIFHIQYYTFVSGKESKILRVSNRSVCFFQMEFSTN